MNIISNTGWSAKANVMLGVNEGYNEIKHFLIPLQQKMRSLLQQAK